MQSTKIIRRLDDLGRVVIPKSMRKNLKIRTGDNLEFFISEDGLTLKKYSPFKEYFEVVVSVAKCLKNTLKKQVVITSKDRVIFSTDKSLSVVIKENDVKVIIKNSDGTAVENLQILQPIVADEVLGYIAILGDNDLGESELKIVEFCANFLADFYGFGDKND